MKKSYPSEKYSALFLFSIIFFLSSMLPIYEKSDESISVIIIWICFYGILSLVLLIIGLYNFQFYKIIGDVLILRNVFGKMEEINLNNVVYEIKKLDTKCFMYKTLQKKWICIYEENGNIKKFEKGCSNRKNMHRVQIIYSEKFLLELEKRNVRKLVE